MEKGNFNGSLTMPQQPQSQPHNKSQRSSVSEREILCLCARIAELQRSIEKALIVDNKVADDLNEIETKLLLENQELRRLVAINEEFRNDLQQFVSHADYREFRSQSSSANAASSQKMFRVANATATVAATATVVNGLPKENNGNGNGGGGGSNKGTTAIVANSNSGGGGGGKFVSKFPPPPSRGGTALIVNNSNNHNSNSSSSSSAMFLSDDDDDHSSVASDASVKTLI